MRLKAIRLSGFKSFVDPTTVPFSTNLTGIVGPNGCGKSNTIDAVRWVMGESSAKYLRGDAMTDVIFNGSAERKAIGKASVDLVFDNSAGTLRGEYAKYNEISVRRQVTRDGQSTYYLNGTKCRRKDITDLFLGTGLGPRSYAIIEQGMISRLIEAKPEELRVYVEEAAGISKYKERRRETENRMRRTQENLDRLSDIRIELERQLAHLQRQAQTAEKYKLLKEEERQKKAELVAIRWTLLNEEYEQEDKQIKQLEVQQEGLATEQNSANTQIEELKLLHQERTDAFNHAQGSFYEVGSRIARQEQKIEHHSQISLQLNQDLAEIEKGLLDHQRQLEQDQLAQEEVAEQLEYLEPELEILQESEEESAAQLLDVEESQRQWQQDWDQFAQRASEPTRRADVAQSRIQSTEQQVLRLQQQLQRLEAEREQLVSDPEFEDFSLLQEEVSEIELSAESQQERLETVQQQLLDTREKSDAQRKELDTERQRLQQMQGRKATLEALQKAALGQSNEAVSHWLESHQLARSPRVAQDIQVEAGWELAVEVVMGDYLQAVLVEDMNKAANWLGALSDGTLTLWQAASASYASQTGRLSEKVRSSQDISGLLNSVHTAANLADALAMRETLAEAESVITPEGIWLGKHWLRLVKDEDNQQGILSRQQELEALDIEIDDLDINVEEWEADLDGLLLRQHSLEQERETAQREWQQVSQQLVESKSRLSAQQAKAEQLRLRTDKLDQSVAELQETLMLENEALAELRIEWQDAMSAVDVDSDERERLQNKREQLEQALARIRSTAGQNKDRLHQLQLQVNTYKSKDEALKSAITRLADQLKQLNERKQQVMASQNQDHSADLEMLKAELQEMLEQRLTAEQSMSAARQVMDETGEKIRLLELRRAEVENNKLAIRNQLEQVRMNCQALDIRRQGLVEQLEEDKLSMHQVLQSLPEAANVDEWSETVQNLGEKIQRLGAINLAAIDEYQLQSERKVYLDTQNEDLEKALATLEGAIQKIDSETRNRFKETFDKLNAGLTELFPKVFGGGHASLELTGDDVLNTGVAIMARPPGKKNSTIHLLSGGEKALTAIALVFSIFQLNPAPFCMLDEVDAPLDDANVGRYARLVKAMSEKVQFIYITHNKIAMEMAEQLMGVTMHEPGVSRLVSVDIEEAASMVEA